MVISVCIDESRIISYQSLIQARLVLECCASCLVECVE